MLVLFEGLADLLTPSSIAAVRAISLSDSSEGESHTSTGLNRLVSTVDGVVPKRLTHHSHD